MNPINLALALIVGLIANAWFTRWARTSERRDYTIALISAIAAAINLWTGLP